MSAEALQPDFLAEVRKLRDCLHAVDFLGQLKMDELDKLMGAVKKRRYPADYTVITQGDIGEAFYLIASGKVSIWIKGKKIKHLFPAEYFGESALVMDAPRSATVKTEEDTELYILHKDAFKKILMANPAIAASIKAHMAKIKAERY